MPIRFWCNFPDAAESLFENSLLTTNIEIETGPFPGFDFWVRLNCVAMFDLEKNFDGFNNSALNRLYLKNSGLVLQSPWEHYVRFHPQLDGEAARTAVQLGWNRQTLPYQMLGLKPRSQPYWLDFDAHDFRQITRQDYWTVHDGFDTTLGVLGRATKTWNLESWAEVIREVRKAAPDLLIVQIGGKNSRSIPGVDINMVGKTDFQKALEILNGSKLHVDGDSGFAHAAAHMRVPAVVMFGPTPREFFGYDQNTNIGPSKCGGCFWTVEPWIERCMLGYPTPVCMDSISAEEVIEAATRLLRWTRKEGAK